MTPVRYLIAGIVALALLAATASAAAGPRVPARDASARAVQHVAIAIRGGDRIVEPNFAVAAGVPVQLRIRNYTHEFHSFTAPGVGVSALVKAARGHAPATTVVRFTPKLVGTFDWDCVICPSGKHGHPHRMGGRIYVIIDPSVFG